MKKLDVSAIITKPCQYFLLMWFLCYSTGVLSQPNFINEASQRGILDCTQGQEGFGVGAAAADYDNDGFVDIYLPMPNNASDRIYRNMGNGTFVDVAKQLGLVLNERSRSGLWFDYNGDQRLDLLVITDCFREDCNDFSTLLHLYEQNPDGQFTEVTQSSGLTQKPISRMMHRSGVAAGDLNGNGFLDLVTGFWEGAFYLYLNQGDGTFIDASVSSGLGDADVMRGHWQPMIQDFNGDGRVDIYVTVDFGPNKLWINDRTVNGIPQLIDVSMPSFCDNDMNDMGVAMGDFDEDGDPDIYATNIFRDDRYNVLLRNDTLSQQASCTEVSAVAVVRDGGWGWGTTFLDVNNDTYLDLAETNGWQLNGWEQPARLFMNQPDNVGVFLEKGAEAGMTSTHWASALLSFDIDRDGDLDLIESVSDACFRNRPVNVPLSIYTNQLEQTSEPHHYLLIKPRIDGFNARAIGAKIEVKFKGRTLTRWITAGTSFLGQEPAEAFFGLADVKQVDSVTVTWPDGEVSVVKGVAVDQELIITYIPRIFINGFEAP